MGSDTYETILVEFIQAVWKALENKKASKAVREITAAAWRCHKACEALRRPMK